MTTLDDRFAMTMFVVEATHCEGFLLWRMHGGEVIWVQDRDGLLLTIGHIGDRPVCVCFQWATINGKLVMFYEAVSEIVDHKMVNAWLAEHCNPGHWARCNADNFHILLQFVNT